MIQTRFFKKVGEKTVHNKMEKFKIEVTLFLQSIIKIELNFESNFATPTQITFKNNFINFEIILKHSKSGENDINEERTVKEVKYITIQVSPLLSMSNPTAARQLAVGWDDAEQKQAGGRGESGTSKRRVSSDYEQYAHLILPCCIRTLCALNI